MLEVLEEKYKKDHQRRGCKGKLSVFEDNRMGILVGTSKEDGTGKAYFMMFSR